MSCVILLITATAVFNAAVTNAVPPFREEHRNALQAANAIFNLGGVGTACNWCTKTDADGYAVPERLIFDAKSRAPLDDPDILWNALKPLADSLVEIRARTLYNVSMPQQFPLLEKFYCNGCTLSQNSTLQLDDTLVACGWSQTTNTVARASGDCLPCWVAADVTCSVSLVGEALACSDDCAQPMSRATMPLGETARSERHAMALPLIALSINKLLF